MASAAMVSARASSQDISQLFPEVVHYTGTGASAWFTPTGQRVIFVDPGFREQHSRAVYDFTIAHETAHHVLGHVDRYDEAHRFGFLYPYNARALELEADCAAAQYFVRRGRGSELRQVIEESRAMYGAGGPTHPSAPWRIAQIVQCARDAAGSLSSGERRSSRERPPADVEEERHHYTAVVTTVSGRGDVGEHDVCVVTLYRGEECRARIRCASDHVVYGEGRGGYYDCPLRPGSGSEGDPDVDEDPAFSINWRDHTLRVWGDGWRISAIELEDAD